MFDQHQRRDRGGIDDHPFVTEKSDKNTNGINQDAFPVQDVKKFFFFIHSPALMCNINAEFDIFLQNLVCWKGQYQGNAEMEINK